MKRMHIHVGVNELEPSIKFYNALFKTKPTKTESDYAKWMLDDPAVNFAISTHMGTTGVQHLGLQVDHEEEMQEVRQRLENADLSVFDEGETQCCYAHSDKSWVEDPTGIKWEAFRTIDNQQADQELTQASKCCEPNSSSQAECCEQKQAG